MCKDLLTTEEKPQALMIHSGDIQLSKPKVGTNSEKNIFSGIVSEIYPAYRVFELLIDIGLPLVVNISQKQLFQLEVSESDRIECYIAPENIQKIYQ